MTFKHKLAVRLALMRDALQHVLSRPGPRSNARTPNPNRGNPHRTRRHAQTPVIDTIIWIPSVVLGLLLVGGYVIGCWRGHRQVELSILVNVMIASQGVVGGLALVASMFVTSFRANLTSLWLYIVIGGLVVVAVSVSALYQDLIARNAISAAATVWASDTDLGAASVKGDRDKTSQSCAPAP